MNALTRFRGQVARWTADAARQGTTKQVTASTLSPVGGWWPRILESYPGAWQQNVVVDQSTVAAYWAVFACVTLIAKDISKLWARVMELLPDGTYKETDKRPVLQRPNHYQTRVEFFFDWMRSQLMQGNTYVLKQRNRDGFTIAMYVLCPSAVTPMVSPDGSVFYRLSTDNLAGVEESVMVPASEIIHERMYTLYHPLIGVSPIFACGVGAMQGAAIQDNSAKFFQNMSRPSGLLVAPGAISPETAATLKSTWESNYKGANIGRVAVLGDGLKYEAMTINAHDAQLIEQLKMTGEMVAACYHVPGYKIGVGPMPTVNNTAALNQQYYDQALQYLIEKSEARLTDGLELVPPLEVIFDLSGLLRMDPMTRYDSHQKAIAAGWKSPDEVRVEENLRPTPGGKSVYMQSQNRSLESLSLRDAQPVEGSQAAQLQGILGDAAAGKIPADTAKAAIKAMFPLLTDAQVTAMLTPLDGFEPTPDTPPPGGGDAGDMDGEKLLHMLRRKSPETLCHA